MLVTVVASVAGAETKKKTIKSMKQQEQQQQQQQQATNAQMTDYDWAVEYCYHEDFDKALTHINNHLKKNPNDPYGWTCLAAIQSQTGNNADAEKSIDKARKCAGNASDPEMLNWMYYTQSTIYLQQQDTVRAINALGNAVKYDPTDVESYMRLGNIYNRQHEYDLAMVNYGMAVQHDPNNVEGYLGLGSVASSLKKRNDAIKAFSMAIKLEPDFAECYAMRAVEYYNNWEYGKAMDDIIQALELENDNMRALWVLKHIKEVAPEDADKALKKKAKKSKDNSWLDLLN